MKYRSEFIPLSAALEALRSTGRSEEEIKLEICYALNDGKLRYRAWKGVTEEGMPWGQTDIRFDGAGPALFDWQNSSIIKEIFDHHRETRFFIRHLEVHAEDLKSIWHVDPTDAPGSVGHFVQPAMINGGSTRRQPAKSEHDRWVEMARQERLEMLGRGEDIKPSTIARRVTKASGTARSCGTVRRVLCDRQGEWNRN